MKKMMTMSMVDDSWLFVVAAVVRGSWFVPRGAERALGGWSQSVVNSINPHYDTHVYKIRYLLMSLGSSRVSFFDRELSQVTHVTGLKAQRAYLFPMIT